MDSLLASYASSDDEEEQQQQPKPSSFLSLPQPNSSSSLSLPQPKQPKPRCPPPQTSFSSLPEPKSSVFASLPPPNSSSVVTFGTLATSENPQAPSNPPSSGSKPMKVVQLRPPVMLKPPVDEDDDDGEEEKQRKPLNGSASLSSASSLSSFFSSLPAPKNTQGSGSAPSLGAGRRSIVETVVSSSNYNENDIDNTGAHNNQSQESYTGNLVDGSSSALASESFVLELIRQIGFLTTRTMEAMGITKTAGAMEDIIMMECQLCHHQRWHQKLQDILKM